MSRKGGRLVHHEDGRVGIAYHKDQSQDLLAKNKVICRWYVDDDMSKELKEEKVSVKIERLTVKGFVD